MANQPKANVYFIKQQQFPTYEETYKEFKAQRKVLKRLHNQHPKASIIMVLSEVNGDFAAKHNICAGKVGRPKYEFRVLESLKGKVSIKTNPHIHIYIAGEYAATIAKEFALRRCKQFYKKHPDTSVLKMPFIACPTDDGMLSMKYLKDQATNTSIIGDRAQLNAFDRDIASEADVQRIASVRTARQHNNFYPRSGHRRRKSSRSRQF